MSAPVPGARSTPAGIHLNNGHSTKIAFAADPDVSFWEKTVKPPGLDGGDPIDITTMFNADVRTKAARSLIDMTEGSVTAAYDPNLVNNILALINVETTVTVHYPDGSTYAFFGYLKMVDFADMVEGEFPECTITVIPTNVDPAADVEALPALASVAGT